MSQYTPPLNILPVLAHLKSAYQLWFEYYTVLPKTHRYTLGQKIDNSFIEIIELTAAASFLKQNEKLPEVKMAIRKLDGIKILVLILWETKSFNNNKYAELSKRLDEIGKMLGGWHGQLLKQNSPNDSRGEK